MKRLAALVMVLALAGCGDDDSEDPGAAAPATDDPGAAHIHGVGVDPADDAVLIATHYGLFRVKAGETRATRVGDSRQDTMGFTVVGPKRYLGSGHPDLRDDLPPLLGLIRSGDAGRTWDPVSLQGEADFHVLRASGDRIYGVNATDGALLVSDDGGRRWSSRTPPAPPIDLAIDPADPNRVVVSTERGLFASPNAGRGWRPLDADLIGLLTWTDDLTLIDASGTVHASADAGRSFSAVGRLGGQPAALATHEGELVAGLHDNTVHVSADGGRTWNLRAAGA
jgi:hypothetical protein